MIWPLVAFVQDSLTTKVSDLLQPQIRKGTTMGISLVDDGGTPLFELNSGLRVVPASNLKLFSCAYALQRLGGDFRPRMRFWKRQSTLIVDAPGTPMTTYADLQGIAAKLGRAKVVEVRQAFSNLLPPSWEFDDMPNRYAARVCSFTVDRGGFELWAQAGRCVFRPANFGCRVQRVGSGDLQVKFDPISGVATVFGKVPESETRLDTLAIPRPDAAAAMILGKTFVRRNADLPKAPPDAEIVSPPLRDIVAECLTKSDNQLAEQLMLMAAASEGPLPEQPYSVATARETDFLVKEVGLDPGDLHLEDGSGLSRHNLITSRAITKLLIWCKAHLGEDYTRGLPSPGRGTLSGRLSGLNVMAKTGSLDMVSSFSGFLKTSTGQNLVFSLVFNGYSDSDSEIRALQDAIVRTMDTTSFGTVFDSYGWCEVSVPFSSNRAPGGHRFY